MRKNSVATAKLTPDRPAAVEKKELVIRDIRIEPDLIDYIDVSYSHGHIWLFHLDKFKDANYSRSFNLREEDARKLLKFLREVL